MKLVILPIANVSGTKVVATDNQEVLGFPFFGRVGEIERSSDYRSMIDNHHLVVCYGMSSVKKCLYAGVYQEISR